MSHDARARQSRKISVCFLYNSPKDHHVSVYDRFFTAMGLSPDEIDLWAYDAPDMIKTWAQRTEMPISDIPCDITVARMPVEERLAYPLKACKKVSDFGSGYRMFGNRIPDRDGKPLPEFDIFVFGHVQFAQMADHSYLQDIAERNPDMIVTGMFGDVFPREYLLKLRAQRDLLELMTRNTLPLISMAMLRVGCATSGLRDMMRVLCAPEIQLLLRLKHKGLDRERWSRSHALRTLRMSRMVTDELDADPKITEIGEALIASLHPSAYDPGFVDRWKTWMKDPEAHVTQYRRWIRTWSGRLRRHQARTWKASIPKAAFDAATAEIEARISAGRIFSRADTVRSLCAHHPDMGGPSFFETVIKHRMVEYLNRGDLVSGVTHLGDAIYGLPRHSRDIHWAGIDMAAIMRRGDAGSRLKERAMSPSPAS